MKEKWFNFLSKTVTYSTVRFALRFVNLFVEVSRVCAMALHFHILLIS